MSSIGVSPSNMTTLCFRLKHFNGSIIHYILEKTGYTNLTEYEDMCRNTDKFIHRVETGTGTISWDYSEIDYKLYRIFQLSIHNLNDEARHYVMTNYIKMSQIEYELKYPERNKLYVWVPYKNEEARLAETVSVDVGLAPGAEEEDTIELAEEAIHIELKEQMKSVDNLSGWTFKMNNLTKNSYVLMSPKKIQMVQDGNVFWGDSSQTINDWLWTPTTWHAPVESLHRPIYYHSGVGGWIVSLKYRTELLDAGAKEYK